MQLNDDKTLDYEKEQLINEFKAKEEELFRQIIDMNVVLCSLENTQIEIAVKGTGTDG